MSPLRGAKGTAERRSPVEAEGWRPSVAGYFANGLIRQLVRALSFTASLLFLISTGACGSSSERLDMYELPVDAYCRAQVVGVGEVDVESDYLPHVVACENGDAPDEALRAQAVAARSYLYYELLRSGSIADGTEAQVYTCAKSPAARHFEAVRSTAGQVLGYGEHQVAAFYVAGAIPSTTDCRPSAGDPDPFTTEHYVTYNEGRTGSDVAQTDLGLVDPENLSNRGCMSQNGSACLASKGEGYEDILRYYYGADIEFDAATGSCVDAPTASCSVLGQGETVIDEGAAACFLTDCTLRGGWQSLSVGFQEHHFRLVPFDTGSEQGETSCEGRWLFDVKVAGTYLVDVFLPEDSVGTSVAHYEVHHGDTTDAVDVAQNTPGQWLSLGEYAFQLGGEQWVRLVAESGQPSDGALLFDAVRLTPVLPLSASTEDGGSEAESGGGGREISGGCSASGGGHVAWAIAALLLGIVLGLRGQWLSGAPQEATRRSSRA